MKFSRHVVLACLAVTLVGCNKLHKLMGVDKDSPAQASASLDPSPIEEDLLLDLTGEVNDAYGNKSSTSMKLAVKLEESKALIAGTSDIKNVRGIGVMISDGRNQKINIEKMALTFPVPFYIRSRTYTYTDASGTQQTNQVTAYSDKPFEPTSNLPGDVQESIVTITDGAAREYTGHIDIAGNNAVRMILTSRDGEQIVLHGYAKQNEATCAQGQVLQDGQCVEIECPMDHVLQGGVCVAM